MLRRLKNHAITMAADYQASIGYVNDYTDRGAMKHTWVLPEISSQPGPDGW